MGLSTEHQQKRRPSDSNRDYMSHKDNGKESHPQAGHKMSEIQTTHVRHAGHSVAMFRDKFWLSFALTIPVVFWSTDVQHWLGYTALTFPGSKFIPPILGTVVFVYGGLVFIRGAWGELAETSPKANRLTRGHHPNRIGSKTPSPSTKSHKAGAGVPTGRIRRNSRPAARGSKNRERV
jgi:cation transport ATPase